MPAINTIPAKDLVAVNPSVLAAGGTGLDLVGLFLTTSVRVPIGTVLSFGSPAAVGAFFGLSSIEYAKSLVYFAGFDNSNIKPETMLFAQYPISAVAAYLRGGNASGLTLTQLQALTGSLTIVMDGYSHVISSVSLSAATSFSSAATIIQAAFTNPTEASFTASLGASFTGNGSGTNLTTTAVTGLISPGDAVAGSGVPANTTIVSQTSGTPGGAGVYVTSNATTSSSASLTSTSTVLDVTIVASGALAVGQTLVGSGVTGTPQITAQLTGTAGGAGTYRISGPQLGVASESMTATATAIVVSYDSVSGGFVFTSGDTGAQSTSAFATGTLAAPLFLTSATGATLSQGAAAATPAAFMGSVIALTQDWATFATMFDPDQGSGNSQKLAFAAWVSTTNDRYAYVCWDTDVTPTQSAPATGSLGYLIAQANYSGTILVWEPSDLNLAAFVCGMIASIDFTETGGRITLAYKGQAGLTPSVTNETVANNLIANGYNFYGVYATAAQQFNLFQRGVISGPFDFADTYVNQIWLNNQFQLDLILLLQQARSVPYNPTGYALIEASLANTIQDALNNGVIQPGVTLSAAQIAEVNAAAGVKIDGVLSTRGWYLQVLDASPTVRQNRGSPPCTFWYTDGESVQQITLASVVLQ